MLRCGGRVHTSPEALYRSIEARFIAGALGEAEAEANQAVALRGIGDSGWAARFRLLQARIEIYRGNSPQALDLLLPSLAEDPHSASSLVLRDSLLAIAYARTGDLARANQSLRSGEARCRDNSSCSQLHLAEGVVAVEEGRLDAAEQGFRLSLANARSNADKFEQTQALLGIGVVVLRDDHYEEALNLFNEAAAIAGSLGARQALEKAEGNAGSTIYRMGDFRRALERVEAAARVAHTIGSPIDEVSWLYIAGLSHYKLGELKAARVSFEESYRLARSIQNKEEESDALFALASLSLQEGSVTDSLAKTREAERVAAETGNSATLLEPTLLEAEAMGQQGNIAAAQSKLTGVLQRQAGVSLRPFERWQIESTLARLAEASGDPAGAAAWFQRAIDTFRLQRDTLSHIDSKLPFSENGTSLYLGYMEELVRQGRPKDALLVLDRSRAETLSESSASSAAPAVPAHEVRSSDLSAIANRLQSTILVYCLRPQTSYLWIVTQGGTRLIRLEGKETILPLIQNYSQAILSTKDVLSQNNSPGMSLYRALVAPAGEWIQPNKKVFVIADGELSHLNFETLIVPGDRPHFWIEDADVVNAKSLNLLASRASGARLAVQPSQTQGKLLLIGDPVYSRPEYAKLPHSAEEVTNVAGHFPAEQRSLLTGAQATRAAYLTSHPGSFRYIHFVAHATASEINPLDSAVVLSAQAHEPDVYKLYARDIMNTPIHAEVVTISTCFGSGVRSYSSEGLVGLAWAFLRAGSHHVVGALWEVSDASTPLLMNDLYDGLAAGRDPDVALRSAKLAMIERGGVFRKPFYWAAFQLYSGA